MVTLNDKLLYIHELHYEFDEENGIVFHFLINNRPFRLYIDGHEDLEAMYNVYYFNNNSVDGFIRDFISVYKEILDVTYYYISHTEWIGDSITELIKLVMSASIDEMIVELTHYRKMIRTFYKMHKHELILPIYTEC